MGGASEVAEGGGATAPVPYALPPATPSRREKSYMCPLDPSCPLSQRKVCVKFHEMCQNTA